MNAVKRISSALWLVLFVFQPAWIPQPASSNAKPAVAAVTNQDWPQIGRDAQRTNASPLQIDPPYCYSWKWYEAPIASRAQPVISSGRLFIGSMEGTLFARNAETGAPLWRYETGSPIRNSAAVYNGTIVIFTTHNGITYGLSATTGSLLWQNATGSSSTAPLVDETAGRVYVASSSGKLTALNASTGAWVWEYQSSAPILTTPSLSTDRQLLFAGNEAVQAFALSTSNGTLAWSTTLQGQSLADRYPVVAGSTVFYRSQPLYFFHKLLAEGDDTMDLAGAWTSSFNPTVWANDWANVRPHILTYLNTSPSRQTFFALQTSNGASRGTVPVLYTYGNNDIPAVPVVQGSNVFLAYRARHGIQTDSGTVHVTSRYDAELGNLNTSTLDITGLDSTQKMSGVMEFRLTSDEPAMLTMSGNILLVDNWERIGGINVQTKTLVAGGAVSNDWPECGAQCGPGTDLPFFPMSGTGAAYPFPIPRVTEGHQRGGAAVASDRIYWRINEGGLAAMAHRSGSSCPEPTVWGPVSPPAAPAQVSGIPRTLETYLSLDLTQPSSNPPSDLVSRLSSEVTNLVASGNHWMPFYLERGFSNLLVWPYNTDKPERPPLIGYESHGNVYWHDPGDLLISLAMAYPYLDSSLQTQVKNYMATEMNRFPPYTALPYGGSGNQDWLKQGTGREYFSVPMRAQLNNWPPVAASLNALYGLWLWSKNTGDWSYVQSHWTAISALFQSRTPMNHSTGKMDYAADLGGVIGYYRMAVQLNKTTEASSARTVALTAMADLRDNFAQYILRADQEYLDPRDQATGWYAPTLFGLTPEVGMFLREQTNGAASQYLNSKEYGISGDGLRWWYITRAGAHAEVGETSYLAPNAAWSHFMAHAYLVGDKRDTLTTWLDRPWGKADLYSIQKIVATIQALPTVPDFSTSKKTANPTAPAAGAPITYEIAVHNTGLALSDPVRVEDIIPNELTFINGSASATPNIGTLQMSGKNFTWEGVIPSSGLVTLRFQATASVAQGQSKVITNTARIIAPGVSDTMRSARVFVNGRVTNLPVVRR